MERISRRTFVGAMPVAAAAACSAFGASAALADEKGIVTASATKAGFGGDVTVTLAVDTATGKIVDCQIEGANETPGIGGRAVEAMPDRYIEAGSLDVEGFSSASFTTSAIKAAAQEAYNQAMGIVVEAGAVHMKPGTYVGHTKGYWGIWDLPVTVQVTETSIIDISVPESRFEHGETEIILNSVKERLLPRIIKNQSVAIDSIIGATVTSNCVKQAVREAVEEALAAGGSDATAIEAFLKPSVKTDEGIVEEREVDLLVVGMSTGGILAMKSAYEKMVEHQSTKLCSMLAIDRAGKFGGKSAFTHGGMHINPTKFSEDVYGGVVFCDPEVLRQNFMGYCVNEQGELTLKPECLDMFIAESGKTMDWMHELGWHFGKISIKEGTVNIANGAYSANLVTAPNSEPGSYEDRRWWVDQYYRMTLAYMKAHGAEYMLETEAYDLDIDEDGKVGTIYARNLVTGREYRIKAKAVIMGTGGFGSNDEMLNANLPEQWQTPTHKVLGTGQDTGLFLQAVINAGAGTWNLDAVPNIMHISLDHYMYRYPFKFDEGVLDGRTGRTKVYTLNSIPLGCGTTGNCLAVNRKGERFMDEKNYCTGYQFEHGPDQGYFSQFAGTYYYAILSDDVMKQIAEEGFTKVYKWEGYCSLGEIPKSWGPVPEVYEGLGYAAEEGMAWQGETLADLAKQIDIDPAVLEQTVADYNAMCDAGEDSAFGKDPAYLTKFTSGPYWAVRVYNVIFCTLGGLDVDAKLNVLAADHATPIKGLYAIGSDSFGVIGADSSKGYIGSAANQGWIRNGGRVAGANAAEYIFEEYGGYAETSYALSNIAAVSTTR